MIKISRYHGALTPSSWLPILHRGETIRTTKLHIELMETIEKQRQKEPQNQVTSPIQVYAETVPFK